MPTRVTEYLDEKIRTTIDHLRLLLEVGRAVDHAEHFYDPGDAVQIAKGRFRGRQDLQSDFPRGLVTFLDRQRATELTALRLIARSSAGDKEEIAGLDPPDIARNRLHRLREFDPQVLDRLLSAHESLTSFMLLICSMPIAQSGLTPRTCRIRSAAASRRSSLVANESRTCPSAAAPNAAPGVTAT